MGKPAAAQTVSPYCVWDYDQPVTGEYFRQAFEPLLQNT
jgi:hypothetical protein